MQIRRGIKLITNYQKKGKGLRAVQIRRGIKPKEGIYATYTV